MHFTEEGTERPGWDRSWKSWMLRQQDWTKQRQEQRQDNVTVLRPTGTGGHTPFQNVEDQSVYKRKL